MLKSPAMDTTLYEDVNMTTSLPSKGSPTPPPLPPPASSLGMDTVNLHLVSPQLESFTFHPHTAMDDDGLPSLAVSTPTQVLFPRSVTEEQEEYARGFVEALSNIHRSQGARVLISDHSATSQGAGGFIGGNTQGAGALIGDNTQGARGFIEGNTQGAGALIGGNTQGAGSLIGGNTQRAGGFIGGNTRMQGAGAIIGDHASTQKNVSNVSAGLTYTTLTTLRSKGTLSGPATSSPLLHGSSKGTLSGSITSTPLLHGSSVEPMQFSSRSGSVTHRSYNSSEYVETKQHSSLGNIHETFMGNRIIQLKEEPQTVPCLGTTPPISPLRVDVQEHIKVERKRERNREAARKCRNKKLEQISRLETRVRELTEQNMRLAGTANALRDELGGLRREILEHKRHGCQLIYDQTQLAFSVAANRVSTTHEGHHSSNQLTSLRESNQSSNQFTSLPVHELNYSPRSAILQSTSLYSSSS